MQNKNLAKNIELVTVVTNILIFPQYQNVQRLTWEGSFQTSVYIVERAFGHVNKF